MDPDATLAIVRTLVTAHLAGTADTDDTSALVDAVHALDEWLSRGGFLPSDWQR